jgi:carbon monoxide dehydrogenase subunit G
MADYRGIVETTKAIEVVFDYIADFRNAAEWDPGTVSISQTAGDGAGRGARYRLVTRFGGRSVPLDYETTDFERPGRLVLNFEGGNISGTDTVTVSRTGDRTLLVYSVDFRLKKLRVLAPLIAPLFRRAAEKALTGLAKALEGTAVRG